MSSQGGEIFAPMPEAGLELMALIQAMRVQSDAQARLASSIDRIAETVQRVSEDVAVLKAQDVRHEIAAASQLSIDLRRDWQEDCRRRDETTQRLLQESLDDRKKLWLAHTVLEGKLQTLTARVLPLLTLGATVAAIVVSVVIERLLK